MIRVVMTIISLAVLALFGIMNYEMLGSILEPGEGPSTLQVLVVVIFGAMGLAAVLAIWGNV